MRYKVVLLSAIFVLSPFLIYFFAFAYSPYYTHPDLTEEISKLFNFKNSNQDLKISQNEIQWMRQGAIDEDTPPRWINHFYDSIHKEGWLGKHFGTLSQAKGLYQGESMAPKPAIASIDWVTNQEYQSAYGRQYGNQTWQKAIKSYIDGDKESAFVALGHILHLIEDASVPDHTRNDTHADLYGDPGSPYEKYSKEYTNFNKLTTAENLKNENLMSFSTIQDAFNYLANYSNNNFFSEDTISNEEFSYPNIKSLDIIEKEDKRYIYDGKNDLYLAMVNGDTRFVASNNYRLYSTDNESLILPSYFSHLAPQAVLTGASVMNLFFQEVEKYKKNPELLPVIIPDTDESIVSYFEKSPRLTAVSIADKCDRLTTDYQINGGWGNAVQDISCSAVLDVAESIDKAVTGAYRAKIFVQGAISNIFSVFSRPQQENSVIATANIGQVAMQAMQPEQAELKTADNKELKNFLVDSLSQPNNDAINNGNDKARKEPIQIEQTNNNQPVVAANDKTNQLEVINAPYQWPASTETIHEPYQEGVINPQPQQNQPSFIFVAGSSEVGDKENKNQQLNPKDAAVLVDNGQNNNAIAQIGDVSNISQVDVAKESSSTDSTDVSQKNKDSNPNNPASSDAAGKVAFSSDQNQTSQNQNPSNQTQSGDDQNVGNQNNNVQNSSAEVLNPDIKFYLTNYDVRKSDFVLNWKDENSIVKKWELQYKLGVNFDWQDLNSQSNVASPDEGSADFKALYDDLTHYFRLRGINANNNPTDWQYLQVDISTRPVVINEIAWMGTQASSNDEWIELANKTDQEVNLKNWTLKSRDQAISVTLNGKIAPYGFYLLERTNDDPIKNISADQIYTGALNDNGQVLNLYAEDGSEVDSVYTVYAGNKANRMTSERISIWSSGEEKNNWKTYVGEGGKVQDASGNKILGTPKAKNSQADLYYYLPTNFAVNKDVIFFQSRGPYVSDNLINIVQSATLNIEPGTVLKFGYQGGMDIYGKLMAKGTAENKIVFTSSDDDQYGGDINSDGQAKIINWRKLIFNDGSSGEINNSLFRYAGNVWTTDNEVFYINKANVKISGSIFENMGKDVLRFENANSDISSSEFKNNKGNAVYIHGGKGDISGNTFDNNKGVGIYVSKPSGRINISTNNLINNKAPIQFDDFGDFGIDLNQVSNNSYNGILIYASSLDGGDVVLSADMPFIIMGFPTIQAGATLEIASGAIIKFDANFNGMTVNGALKAIGTAEKPIVFTSLYDDQSGGDTNNDSAATLPRPGLWAWIYLNGENSQMENVVIKYGGQTRNSMGGGAVFCGQGTTVGGSVICADLNAKNFVLNSSSISNSSANGITILSDGALVENSIFSNNSGAAMSVAANNVAVKNATFNNNKIAFQSNSIYMATMLDLLPNLIFNQNVYNFWPENLIKLNNFTH